jgi:uncharacterized protein (DUF2235 family)
MNDQDILSRLTIKKMNVALNLSRETTAFTADIYYEGEKVGSAENDGNGGATNVWIEREESIWADTLDPYILGDLIERWITAKAAAAEDIKRNKKATDATNKWISSRLKKGMFVYKIEHHLCCGSTKNLTRDTAVEIVMRSHPKATDFVFPAKFI